MTELSVDEARERLKPYIGKRVVVRLHPRVIERVQEFDPGNAERFAAKWKNGRVGKLSDVGERRVYFDLHLRGPGHGRFNSLSWDIPLKGVFSISLAPYDSARRGYCAVTDRGEHGA